MNSVQILPFDAFLRGSGQFEPGQVARSPMRALVAAHLRMIVVCGFLYGVVMGSFGGVTGDGWLRMLFSGIKTPALFMVTFLLCIPSFYVMNALTGVHRDFGMVLHALLGFQSAAAVALVSFAPVTWLVNVSTANYPLVVMWNGIMFAVASLTGFVMMRRIYAPLVLADPRHRLMQSIWIVQYVFVGIQMAWVLRPFIGSPTLPVTLWREGAWGNAYMEVLRLCGRVLGI